MMLESRSTTDGMMPARSGASTVDGRDGYIPIIIGITISMLFGDMSTTLVCMVDISHRYNMLVTYVFTYIILKYYSCYKLNTQNNFVELYHAMIITQDCYNYFDTSNACCFNIAILDTHAVKQQLFHIGKQSQFMNWESNPTGGQLS